MLSSRWIQALALLLTISALAFAAPPPNDQPASPTLISALALGQLYTNTQNTTEATVVAADPFHSCTGDRRNFNTVWFRYAATFTGVLQVNTTGSNYDTVLSGYPGTTIPGAQQQCNDDNTSGSQSAINLDVVNGQSYLIEASSFRLGGGTLTLNARACTFNLNPTNQPIGANGNSNNSVFVTAQPGCTWTTENNTLYVNNTLFAAVTSPGVGSGNGTVNYFVGANTSAIAREGTLAIGGKTLTISQAASGVGVPNVVGLTAFAAINSLVLAKVTLGTVTNASSPTVSSGSVISQNPPPGSPSASPVNLTVSTGPSLAVAPNFSLVNPSQTVLPTSGTAGSAAAPPFDPVVLQNLTPNSLNLTVTVATGSGGNWLTATLQPPSLPANGQRTLVVGASVTHMDAFLNGGKHVGLITIKSNNTTVQIIVLLGVAGVAQPMVRPFPTISLGTVPSGPQTPIRTKVTVGQGATNAGTSVEISSFETNGANWLFKDLDTVVTESTFEVIVDTSALPPGTYTGLLALQGSGFPEVDVGISVTVAVAVPNVVGSTQAAASTAFQALGLIAGNGGSAPSQTIPAGSVISQNPTAGTLVNPGTTVNLTISTGPANVSVPNVVGLTQAAATTAIQGAGLALGTITNATSQTVPNGSVISQSPTPGIQAAPGSAVNLTVSTGPSTDHALLLSQFVGGGTEWNTTLFLTNLSNTAETFTLRFYDDDGALKAMPIDTLGNVNTITGTLNPGETRRYVTGAFPTLQVAWALLTPGTLTAARLSGLAVFRQTVPSGDSTRSSEAVVDFVGTTTSRHVLLYDNIGGFATTMMFANPDSVSGMTILADVLDEQGNLLTSGSINLSPLGHIAFVLTERWPITIDQRGSILLYASPQGFGGLGLRFSPFQTFTSFRLLTSRDIR